MSRTLTEGAESLRPTDQINREPAPLPAPLPRSVSGATFVILVLLSCVASVIFCIGRSTGPSVRVYELSGS